MKALVTLMIVLLANGELFSQQFKPDNRNQLLKDDEHNQYKSELITNFDLIEALEVAGIGIYKFDLGTFDKKYQLQLIQEEFKDGKKIKTDTLREMGNTYRYYLSGKEEYFISYIEKIKIITQIKDNTLNLKFSTNKVSYKNEIQIMNYDKESSYFLRSFVDTKWVLNEKIPLLVYASSWIDKNDGHRKFCGVTNLSINDKGTDELLNSSPHYYMISYIVKE